MPEISRVTIGTLSRRTAVKVETIRYYERVGIMPKPVRSAGGHRLYGIEHHHRLVFFKRSRALGYSLGQVRELLGLTGGRYVTCAKVKKVTEQHIAGIRQKMKDLRRVERVLNAMVARSPGDEVSDCPILDALRSPSQTR